MLVSYKSVPYTTSALTTVTPAHIINARLVATTTADVTVQLHDTSGATSAATRIMTLFTTNPGKDETEFPIRVGSGTLQFVMTGGAASTRTLYIAVR